jgi:hypothetical protein
VTISSSKMYKAGSYQRQSKHREPCAMGSIHGETQDYGRRLLPQILDEVAMVCPDRIVYSVSDSRHGSFQLRHITASAFAKAIDKTAWWLTSLVGSHSSIQSVGYIGPREFGLPAG